MSQPSNNVMIQDHQGKRRMVEVVPSIYRKSLPHTSTKPQEFQYLSAQPVQQQQQQQSQRFSGDGSSQQHHHIPIVVQPMLQHSGGDTEKYLVKSLNPASTSASGDAKRALFASTRTSTLQKHNLTAQGSASINKLAQSSYAINKKNIAIPSTSSAPTTPQTGLTNTRKRKTDKIGKGLRHFSMKVCEKVEQKGVTTYNEVADELVHEETFGNTSVSASYDQKNIRRRVYDALNVLMAMNIISKEKKEIRWIGLPTNSVRECMELEKENDLRRERIEEKQQQLRDLILQQISFKNLVKRNKEAEERGLVPAPNSAIHMPFIILNTHKKTHINCSISNDKSEYSFKFDDNYEIHDDLEVLKQMKLMLGLETGNCKPEDIERAKLMVPKAFEKYIDLYAHGNQDESNVAEYDLSYSADDYSNMSIKLETSEVVDDYDNVMSGEDDSDA